MKLMGALVLLALALGQNPDAQKPVATNEATGVEVAAQVLPANRFCEFGPKAYMVYFPIDITITNARRTPIIVARRLNVQRLLMGATIDDIWAHKYELEINSAPLRIFGQPSDFGVQPSATGFMTLKHNQGYDFTIVQGVPVRRSAADSVPGTATSGSHVLSVELAMWPYTRDPVALAGQWSHYGDLISTPAISFPMTVSLPANPPLEKCGLIPPKEQQSKDQ
jgi:hypothetical protein